MAVCDEWDAAQPLLLLGTFARPLARELDDPLASICGMDEFALTERSAFAAHSTYLGPQKLMLGELRGANVP